MDKNINFIPANELPVTEGDEVFVLCVEGGELKQKKQAKTPEVGNSATVTFRTKGAVMENSQFYEVKSVPTGIFAKIKDGLTSGNVVNVIEVCTVTQTVDGAEMTYTEVVPTFYMHQDLSGHPEAESMAELLGVTEIFMVSSFGMAMERMYFILPDDRVIPQYEAMGGAVNEANS